MSPQYSIFEKFQMQINLSLLNHQDANSFIYIYNPQRMDLNFKLSTIFLFQISIYSRLPEFMGDEGRRRGTGDPGGHGGEDELRDGAVLKLAGFDGGKRVLDEAHSAAVAGEIGDFAAQDAPAQDPLGQIVGGRHGWIREEMPEGGPQVEEILASAGGPLALGLAGPDFQAPVDTAAQPGKVLGRALPGPPAEDEGAEGCQLEAQAADVAGAAGNALKVPQQVGPAHLPMFGIDRAIGGIAVTDHDALGMRAEKFLGHPDGSGSPNLEVSPPFGGQVPQPQGLGMVLMAGFIGMTDRCLRQGGFQLRHRGGQGLGDFAVGMGNGPQAEADAHQILEQDPDLVLGKMKAPGQDADQAQRPRTQLSGRHPHRQLSGMDSATALTAPGIAAVLGDFRGDSGQFENLMPPRLAAGLNLPATGTVGRGQAFHDGGHLGFGNPGAIMPRMPGLRYPFLARGFLLTARDLLCASRPIRRRGLGRAGRIQPQLLFQCGNPLLLFPEHRLLGLGDGPQIARHFLGNRQGGQLRQIRRKIQGPNNHVPFGSSLRLQVSTGE